jgi:multiple sugar transport system substrate-binding protein
LVLKEETMMTSHSRSNTLSRRRLLTMATAVTGVLVGPRAIGAQTPEASPPSFDREASIVSWGFGAEETNPMAFSRIDAFKAAYPSIHIELVPQFDDQKLLTAVASGQLPDLLWMDRAKIASWAARDVLLDLDDDFSSSNIDTEDFYPAALEQVTYDGKRYGLPQFMDVRALYVNLDALGETDTTADSLDTSDWDSLSALGEQLVKADGDKIERWGFDHKIQAGHIWLWGTGNGGSFMSDDGKTATFDDPKVVDALKWGVDAYDRQGGYQKYQAVSTTWQGDEQFARGQVALTEYENWMLGIVARVAPDLNFRVYPIKQRGGEGDVSYAGGNAWCIPKDANDPEAAWTFINFMNRADTWRTGAAGVKKFQQSQGNPYVPSLTGSISADQMQIDEFYEPIAGPFDEAVALWPDILKQSFVIPVSKSPVSSQLLDIMQQDGINPALQGDQSPEDSLKDANQAAQDAIDNGPGA